MSPWTLEPDVDLRPRNTFRVAARARIGAWLNEPAALPDLLARPELEGLPLLVLGDGSNVLFAADFAGAVLGIDAAGVRIVGKDGESTRVRVEAGYGWDALVDWTLERGLAGLENLALIPGRVGAAPIQNIGAYGAEAGEYIAGVEAFDRRSGSWATLGRDECAFGYRDSVFKRDPARWILTAVEFRLPRVAPLRLDYSGVREELAAMGRDAATPRDVAEAVRRLRRRKLPDPAEIGNAGSFFKNPVVAAGLARGLAAAQPGLPVFDADAPDRRKLSAAWLIEACGWKGHREGDAGVSPRHALVLVNHGEASGAQLLDLARRIAESVYDRFGVALEPEPRIVGHRWEDPR